MNLNWIIIVINPGSHGEGNHKNKKVIKCPAFSNKVVDKVGAGDTMLALVALCLKLKVPSDLTLFLGSLAGASAVENIGNSKNLERKNLLRTIEFILK